MSVCKEPWEEGDFWGGGRVLKKMRQTGWPGRAAPMRESLPLLSAFSSLQLAGLFSCVVVLAVLLWLGPFFYYLPKVGRKRGACSMCA